MSWHCSGWRNVARCSTSTEQPTTQAMLFQGTQTTELYAEIQPLMARDGGGSFNLNLRWGLYTATPAIKVCIESAPFQCCLTKTSRSIREQCSTGGKKKPAVPLFPPAISTGLQMCHLTPPPSNGMKCAETSFKKKKPCQLSNVSFKTFMQKSPKHTHTTQAVDWIFQNYEVERSGLYWERSHSYRLMLWFKPEKGVLKIKEISPAPALRKVFSSMNAKCFLFLFFSKDFSDGAPFLLKCTRLQ